MNMRLQSSTLRPTSRVPYVVLLHRVVHYYSSMSLESAHVQVLFE